jgi:hypothetical protein
VGVWPLAGSVFIALEIASTGLGRQELVYVERKRVKGTDWEN